MSREHAPAKVYDGSGTDAITGKWYAQFIVTVERGTLELDAQGNYRTSYDFTLVEDGTAQDATLRAQGTYEIDGGRSSWSATTARTRTKARSGTAR